MTCAQARVPDPTKVCVAVGLGFFVELTLDEALTFISKKDADLNKQVRNLLACISLMTLECIPSIGARPLHVGCKVSKKNRRVC